MKEIGLVATTPGNHNVDCTYTDRIELNTLRSRQNGPQFADYIFKYIFVNKHCYIFTINDKPALVYIMA